MVFVKVRETYDLHTIKNKMTVIGIHTPKPTILKRNYPGLLMQCRAYRPVSANVRLACASVLPLDPKGVGLSEGDVAPEDIFNPILYKAMTNKGMSQLEARVNMLSHAPDISGADVDGDSATVDVDSFTNQSDEFAVYYGLLSNTHDWKHANPQAGLSMSGLRPLVYERLFNVGDDPGNLSSAPNTGLYNAPSDAGLKVSASKGSITGSAKSLPFINCTAYSLAQAKDLTGLADSGFPDTPKNCEVDIPWINCVVGCIIVPPSRLHELFYRMVIEWTVEFSKLRPIGEITDWNALGGIGANTHYQNYSYEATKEAVTGTSDTILANDSTMASANVDINKVM